MKRRGFTLLEMMLVIILLGVGIFPLMQLFSSSVVQSSGTTKNNLAIHLAQQKIEQIKNISFSAIESTSEAVGSIQGYVDFSREAVVSEVSPNLKDITVTVYWGSGASSGSFSVRTYIANY